MHIFLKTYGMHPETLRHNQSLAMDICTDPCTGKISKSIPLFADNKAGNRVIGKLHLWYGKISLVVYNPADLNEVLDRLEAWTFTGLAVFTSIDCSGSRYLNLRGEFDFENAIPEPDFYDPIIDFCNSQIEKAKSEPKKVNRVYVSVFSDRFLIDSEGILYARRVQGDENLCMHTEAGNLFTVIGWDLDGNPCTISDTYSLFENRF